MHARKLPSGNWCVEAYAGYNPKTKKKYRKTFTGPDLKALKLAAAIWENEHKAVNDPDTIGGLIKRYVDKTPLSPSTKRSYLSMLKNLPPWLVKTPCLAFSPSTCERFIAEANISPKSIKNRLGLISAALGSANISMPNYHAPRVPLPELNIPDAETVKATIAGADKEMQIVILLAATGPLRLGEICGLSLEDIDKERNVIHVKHSLVYGADHKYHLKEPKTRKSDRYIDMSPELIEAIFEQGFVTRSTPKGIYARFKTILRQNNIAPYRFHDLRHFCISELLSQNMPESYVSERSGHTSHATMQRYIHVLGNRRREASEKILAHFDDVLRTEKRTEK